MPSSSSSYGWEESSSRTSTTNTTSSRNDVPNNNNNNNNSDITLASSSSSPLEIVSHADDEQPPVSEAVQSAAAKNQEQQQQKSKVVETPLPVMRILVACLFVFCEGLSSLSILPYLGFMIMGFGIADNRNDVGYYAGVVTSAYFFAQFLSSFIWGRLSDKFGRRPILMTGISLSFITSILFGFSKWYWFAIVARFLAGLVNGNVGVVRSYVGEITDRTNAAKAFSYVGLMWGLSGMVGPMIGGYLSQPVDKYPSLQQWMPLLFKRGSGLFDAFPFLLPNLFSALINALGIATGFFFLTESNTKAAAANANAAANAIRIIRRIICCGRRATRRITVPTTPTTATEVIYDDDDDGNNNDSHHQQVEMKTIVMQANTNQEEEGEDEGNTIDDSMTLVTIVTTAATRKNDDDDDDDDQQQQQQQQQPSQQPPSILRVLMQRPVVLSCLCFSMVQISHQVFSTLLPLWAMVSVAGGGLSFTSNRIGLVNFVSGVWTVVFQLALNARISNRLGLLRTFRLGVSGMIPTTFLLPFAHYLLDLPRPAAAAAAAAAAAWMPAWMPEAAMWAAVLGLTLARTSALLLSTTQGQRLVSNSVEKQYAGSAFGLSQSFNSGANTFAPTLAGIVLAWSVASAATTTSANTTTMGEGVVEVEQQHKHPWPINFHFSFVLLTLWLVCLLGLSLLIPSSVNAPKSSAAAPSITEPTTTTTTTTTTTNATTPTAEIAASASSSSGKH